MELNKLIRTNKYRLYPSSTQKALLFDLFSLSRNTWNLSLGRIKEGYYGIHEVQSGKNKGTFVPSIPSQTEMIGSTSLKSDHNYLNRLPNDYLQATLTNQYRAFREFIRTHGSRGFPKFKSRKYSNESINMYAGSRVRIKDNYIQIIKTKSSRYSRDDHLIKFKKHRTNHDIGRICTTSISKDNLGKYWLTVTHEISVPEIPGIHRGPRVHRIPNKSVGIDLGIKDIASLSDGTVYSNHKFTDKYSSKLSKYQRMLSRKKKGSSNRTKARIKVAKIHNKIKNSRSHRNHEISRNIVNIYDFIGLETLDLQSMKSKLNRKVKGINISDAGLATLISMLKYKSTETQGRLIQVDKWFPSSQLCSRCNNRMKMDLDTRTYNCPNCGLLIDRDLNASINILREALRIYKKNMLSKA